MAAGFLNSNGKISKFIFYPFYLFICMAFSLNLVHIFALVFDIQMSKGAYWSAALLLSIVLFTILWFYLKKVFSRAIVGYFIINLIVLSLDLVSYYIFKSSYLPKMLPKIFSPYIVEIFNRLLVSLR